MIKRNGLLLYVEICTAPNAIMLSEKKKYSATKNCFHLYENQEHTKLTMDGDRNQDSDCLEKEMATTPEFLPGKFHGRRRLVGYSPWSCKELNTTEPLNFLFLS